MNSDNKPLLAKLTGDDLGTLARAADLRLRFNAGIFPSTIGQRSHFQKLVRRGLLEFDGWGRDIDGEVERDVEIYKLTTAGERLISKELSHENQRLQPRTHERSDSYLSGG